MSKHMDRIIRAAVADGLLDPAMTQPAFGPGTGERHWSVIVFTALAAWLSAIPLLAVILLFFYKESNYSGFVLGLPILLASILVLRAAATPLFAEQLAIPCLVVGAVLVALQLDSGVNSTSRIWEVLTLIAAGVAVAVRQAWLRTLMGAAIGMLAALSLLETMHWTASMSQSLPWLLVACAWLVLHIVSRSLPVEASTARIIAGVEAVSSGMAAATLFGLICSSQTFLLRDLFKYDFADMEYGRAGATALSLLSIPLEAAAGAFLALRVPALRTAGYAALLGLCALLTWFKPGLGVALLILFLCAESGRYVLVGFAGVAAAWLIGGLYYDLHWPLAQKALLLGGVGAAIALLGRYAVVAPASLKQPRVDSPEAPAPALRPVPARIGKRTRVGFLSCGLLVLLVANAAIWQKENVIKNGTAVFVELAPADPRSLMQGDYMSLRFALPAPSEDAAPPEASTPQLVARTDGRGVAQLLRFRDQHPLAKGEFVINLVYKDGQWVLVTDAWYFKEGEAARWGKARYGEFRVGPDGRALLVGLRGPDLERL